MENKNYTVKYQIRNYTKENGSENFDRKKRFDTLDKCEEFIKTLPKIGITKESIFKDEGENTILKIQILLENNIIKILEFNDEELMKKINNEKYTVKYYIRNYIPGSGTDIYEKKRNFDSLEKSECFIQTLPEIGICKFQGNSENTLIKIELLYNNNIIKTLIPDIGEIINKLKNLL
jgi:hypothetical protein